MYKKKVVLPLAMVLLMAPRLASPSSPTAEDVKALTEAVNDNTQVTSAGSTETANALYRAIKDSGVAEAAKAVPEIVKRLEKGEQERYINTSKILNIEYALRTQEKRLESLEDARLKILEVLGDMKSGLAVVVDRVKELYSLKERFLGGAVAILTMLIGAGIRWLVTPGAGNKFMEKFKKVKKDD